MCLECNDRALKGPEKQNKRRLVPSVCVLVYLCVGIVRVLRVPRFDVLYEPQYSRLTVSFFFRAMVRVGAGGRSGFNPWQT